MKPTSYPGSSLSRQREVPAYEVEVQRLRCPTVRHWCLMEERGVYLRLGAYSNKYGIETFKISHYFETFIPTIV